MNNPNVENKTLFEPPQSAQVKRITNDQGLRWLTFQLQRPHQSFRTSETYRLIKTELTKRGNWKQQRRGKPTPSNLIMITKGKR